MIGLPRSTFYYQPQGNAAKGQTDAAIRQRMEQLALEFPRYGYRRRTRRRFVRTTDSQHDWPLAPNLIKGVKPSRPNQIWVSDITYIGIKTGFAYLAAILDAYSRCVVGWALSLHIDADLVKTALQAAWNNREPEPGCIFHSDRGSQYAAADFTDLAKALGFQLSMSGKANPYDNPIAESFFKTLKVEEIYLNEVATIEELSVRLPEFIDVIYNTKRLHSALGYLPPVEFEALQKVATCSQV